MSDPVPGGYTFGEIIGNMIASYVTGQWGSFYDWQDRFNSRFGDYNTIVEGMIEDAVNAVFNLYDPIINDLIDHKWWATSEIINLTQMVQDNLYEAKLYAWNLYDGLWEHIDWTEAQLQNQIDQVDNRLTDIYDNQISPSLSALWTNVTTLQSWRVNTVNPLLDWLSPLTDPIEWLVDTATPVLEDFIADPLGFVLDTYSDMFYALFDFLDEWGDLLGEFIIDYAGDVIDFWNEHREHLWEFFTDPLVFVLDLIYDTFIDWFCGLLADNW